MRRKNISAPELVGLYSTGFMRDCGAELRLDCGPLRFLLLRLGLRNFRRATKLARYARKYLVKGFLLSHFLLALVAAIFMFMIAGAAADFENFFAHHGQDGMVHDSCAAGTMIVDRIA